MANLPEHKITQTIKLLLRKYQILNLFMSIRYPLLPFKTLYTLQHHHNIGDEVDGYIIHDIHKALGLPY